MRLIQACGPSHRDDGNPFYIERALNAIEGVSIQRFPVTSNPAEWGEYDAVLYTDWGQDCNIFSHLPYFVPPKGVKSLCWQSDTHWNEQAKHYRYEQARDYTVPCFCQVNAAKDWKEKFQRGSFWLPHAADPMIYSPSHDATPQWDWCFVGHLDDPDRQVALEQMCQAHGNFQLAKAFFQDCARIYVQSRVVFNKSVRGELNMRTFEAMATRSFLLTDRQIGMEELGLKDGVHAALYDTMPEAIEKMSYYLARPAERERIADAGWKFVLQGHTFGHRARSILKMLE